MSYTGLPPCQIGGIDIRRTIYAGMTQPQLQAAYASLQAAMIALQSGAQVAEAAYTQGDGQKSITFRQSSLPAMRGNLELLGRLLGVADRSRYPNGFVYR